MTGTAPADPMPPLVGAVQQATGLRQELAAVVAVYLWRALAGQSVPPFDQDAAIRAALAAGASREAFEDAPK